MLNAERTMGLLRLQVYIEAKQVPANGDVRSCCLNSINFLPCPSKAFDEYEPMSQFSYKSAIRHGSLSEGIKRDSRVLASWLDPFCSTPRNVDKPARQCKPRKLPKGTICGSNS